MSRHEPYYRADLARIHHLGFGFHADDCAPGIIALLEPVRAEVGPVVEVGCGSGLLTRYLVEAGHRVIATDASPAMLEVAKGYAPEVEEVRQVVLPDDPIPEADAIVSIGHVLSYLPDEASIVRALEAVADALRPGGVVALDVCDLAYAAARSEPATIAWKRDDWALITETSVPTPDRFVREMATFTPNGDGSWRRDDERHDNVMIDTSIVPGIMAAHGVDVVVGRSFGQERLPDGLHTIIGRKRG
jgi:SAM-dependent methyltransferase